MSIPLLNKLKSSNSAVVLLICAILTFQPIFSQVEKTTLRARFCITPTGAVGKCTRLYYCEPLLAFVIQNPQISEQIIYDSLCRGGNRWNRVCCPLSQSEYQPPPPPQLTSSFGQDNSRVQALTPPQCGQSSATFDRVVGGDPAELGAWPWLGLLGYGSRYSNMVGFSCGGSLISSRTVVTAAHCVYNHENELRIVRLGEYNLDQNDESNVVDYFIQKKIVHPYFNPDTAENDIALLILDQDVQYSDAIRPICLPTSDDLQNRNFVGNFPFIAGWGATRFEGPASSVLLETQIPVVETTTCQREYSRVRNAVIDGRVICAGYAQGGKDACQGDSGGPLMFPVNRFYYLIGIVSGGYKCGEPGFPGIYTRVTYFLDFILANLQ